MHHVHARSHRRHEARGAGHVRDRGERTPDAGRRSDAVHATSPQWRAPDVPSRAASRRAPRRPSRRARARARRCGSGSRRPMEGTGSASIATRTGRVVCATGTCCRSPRPSGDACTSWSMVSLPVNARLVTSQKEGPSSGRAHRRRRAETSSGPGELPLRIAEIINSFDIGGGGAAARAPAGAHAQTSPGGACLVIRGPLLPRVQALGFEPEGHPLGGSLASRKALKAIGELARAFRRDRVQVVHAHDFYSAFVAVPAARLAGAGVIVGRLDLGHLHTPAQRAVLAGLARRRRGHRELRRHLRSRHRRRAGAARAGLAYPQRPRSARVRRGTSRSCSRCRCRTWPAGRSR